MPETPTLSRRLSDQRFLRRLKDLIDGARFDGEPDGEFTMSPDVLAVLPDPKAVAAALAVVDGDLLKLRKRARLAKQLAELDAPASAAAPASEAEPEPPSAMLGEIARAVEAANRPQTLGDAAENAAIEANARIPSPRAVPPKADAPAPAKSPAAKPSKP